MAREHGIPVTVLGGGSNVLVADAGIRGLVDPPPRRRACAGVAQIASAPDGGVTINGLVRWTLSRGLAGLEAWAGTPGTVGGAIYGNAHFRGRLISELVDAVSLVTRDAADLRDVPVGGDGVRLRHEPPAADAARSSLSADFACLAGRSRRRCAPSRASRSPFASGRSRSRRRAPAASSRIRIRRATACPRAFRRSAGALVDRAGLKGAREGRARVSPTHGNFIVNEGGATAATSGRSSIAARRGVRERFGVELREEIVYLGAAAASGRGHE